MTDPVERPLRSRPPEQAIRWVEAAAGRGARVTSVRRLRGGDSSAMHAVTVELNEAVQRLVLRRFVRSDWLAEEPDLVAQEATVLRILENMGVPAPRLVAVDEDGSRAGVPSVLMTWLPGRVVINPERVHHWLQRMAALLPAIHSIRPTAAELPWEYAPYTDPRDVQLPTWTSQRKVWRTLIDFARGPRPQATETLIHRDYHPTNILWTRGRITGVVDWVHACRGPAGVDIGHCRRNLALLHGVAVADRFLEHCLAWADYNPYWDVLSLLDADLDAPVYAGWLDLGVALTPATAHNRLDEYAVSLLARL